MPDIRTFKSQFDKTVQHDQKRQAIISAASHLLNRQGSRATTLLEIARALNVTKTSLYYYVKNKQDLIYLCYQATYDSLDRLFLEVESSSGTGLEQLETTVRKYVHNWRDIQLGRAPETAIPYEISALKLEHQQPISDRYRSLTARVQTMVNNGIKDGSLGKRNALRTAHAFLNSLRWSAVWLNIRGVEHADESCEHMIQILRAGLASGDLPESTPLSFHGWDTDVVPGFDKDAQTRLKQIAFLQTGTAFLNARGFRGTSLDDIAKHLNVTKGAFYYYIESKDELLLECFERTFEIFHRVLNSAESAGQSGLDSLHLALGQLFAIQNGDRGPLIRFTLVSAFSADRREPLYADIIKVCGRISQLIDAGQADGSIQKVDSFVATHMIMGAINTSDDLQNWEEIDDLSSASEDYFQFLLRGLMPRTATSRSIGSQRVTVQDSTRSAENRA